MVAPRSQTMFMAEAASVIRGKSCRPLRKCASARTCRRRCSLASTLPTSAPRAQITPPGASSGNPSDASDERELRSGYEVRSCGGMGQEARDRNQDCSASPGTLSSSPDSLWSRSVADAPQACGPAVGRTITAVLAKMGRRWLSVGVGAVVRTPLVRGVRRRRVGRRRAAHPRHTSRGRRGEGCGSPRRRRCRR